MGLFKRTLLKAGWALCLLSLLAGACKPVADSTPTALPATQTSAATTRVVATRAAAATSAALTETPTPPASPTPTLSPRQVTDAYLAAWQGGDYVSMYKLLAPESQAALSAEAFQQEYHAIQLTMTVTSLTATVINLSETGAEAQAQVQVQYTTQLAGSLTTPITLPLKSGAGEWGVVYSPALIWPQLINGATFFMLPDVPQRGNIYDRTGQPMVADNIDIYALGVVPGEIVDDKTVMYALGQLLNVSPNTILAAYQNAAFDQYLPLGEALASVVDQRFPALADVAGIKLSRYTSRYYYGNGTAAHITGYVAYLAQDEMESYLAQGYSRDQRVGRSGLEKWGEAWLAGRNGGTLVLMSAANQPVDRPGYTLSAPAQDITTTVDFKLQAAVQFALADLAGAAVVLNPKTGEVLALFSSPTFDPNLFDARNNYNSIAVNQIFGDTLRPLNNRAAQSAVPAGSVFKIVTMGAGLTSGQFAPDTPYTCTGRWEEILGTSKPDWKEGGHGVITLMQGLAGSCNPYFWHIGYTLHNFNPQWLPDTARAFGLGQTTGIPQIDETAGLIPDPAWKLKTRGETWEVTDSLNLAIGQGDTLVTPLQIARMVAAVSNSGTLLQPQLVLRVQPQAGGAPAYEFQPQAVGQLPLSAEQLAAMQTAMRDVTRDCVGCIGTARDRFRGLRIPVAGKTGTAEDPGIYGTQDPDAWFAGYTLANRTDKPDIAIAVVVNNLGQGSAFAAPIFRRIVESYFGLGLTTYPWEVSVGVVRLPEPTPGAETPTPQP